MKESFNVLTNDPSITAWGFAVVSNTGEVVTMGCIKTKTEGKKRRIRKGDETVRRVSEINNVLLGIIKDYDVDYILSELPHGSQNASAAVMIGVVTGIVQTISDCLQIGVEFYSEGDAKKCALGKLSAAKDEMIVRMKRQYPDASWTGIKYFDEACADALAIYYVARHQSSTLKLMK